MLREGGPEGCAEAVLREAGVREGDSILTGLSGGADSVCLLMLLKGMEKRLGVRVEAMHVHHGIRGRSADEDRDFCRELCERTDTPLTVVQADVPALSAREHLSLEEAGRRVRYESFIRHCRAKGIRFAAVAHHRDDLAETVLMNLLRGSGLRGGAGIRKVRVLDRGRTPEEELVLIRPLLDCGRDELRDWLRGRGIAWRTDETNAEDDYLRNRVRNRLMPLLETEYIPGAAVHLAGAAGLFAEADEYLAGEANRLIGLWEDRTPGEGRETRIAAEAREGKIRLSCSRLLGLPHIMQTYVVREAVSRLLPGLKDLSRSHIESVISLCGGGGSRSLSLPGGVTATAVYDSLVFEGAGKDTPEEAAEEKHKEQQAVWSVFSAAQAKKIIHSSCANRFDYDRIKSGVRFRFREDGDRICVTDGGGHKKLGDWMTDRKIPVSQRGKILLLAQGKDILWIPGGRMAQDAVLTPQTELVLEVRLKGGEKGYE